MKKIVAPLQAVALLLLCSSMAWMVFVLAGINPTPPTVMDLQARNTQDLSFANMNSTAMALAKEMLADMVPSPSGPFLLPVTGRETATPEPTAVVTLKALPSFSSTPTPSAQLPSLIPFTPTRKQPDQPAATAARTLVPTKTLPLPLTATVVPSATRPPTFTPPPTVMSTASPTNSPPTSTPTGKPTDPPTKPPTEPPTPPPTEPPTEPPIPPPTEPPTEPPAQATP